MASKHRSSTYPSAVDAQAGTDPVPEFDTVKDLLNSLSPGISADTAEGYISGVMRQADRSMSAVQLVISTKRRELMEAEKVLVEMSRARHALEDAFGRLGSIIVTKPGDL